MLYALNIHSLRPHILATLRHSRRLRYKCYVPIFKIVQNLKNKNS